MSLSERSQMHSTRAGLRSGKGGLCMCGWDQVGPWVLQAVSMTPVRSNKLWHAGTRHLLGSSRKEFLFTSETH